MSRRRMILRLAAAGIAATLTAGCITQPVDEAALEPDEALGVAPAALDPHEARQVAGDARRLVERHADDADAEAGIVWTKRRKRRAEGGGGLVREDSGRAGTDEDSTATTTPKRKRAGSQPADDGGGGGGRDGGKDGGKDGGSSTDGAGPAPADPPTSPSPKPRAPAGPTFQPIASVADPEGDASGRSPVYADVRQLVIESDGTDARVTVAVAGRIPAALADGEVQGLGVDFYRSDDVESDYQLFVDGDADGWRAFLHTPDGVVQYPGAFSIGGRVFVFKLPWASLGGKRTARVNMFIDWSRRRTPLNDTGNDRAPNRGTVTVRP